MLVIPCLPPCSSQGGRVVLQTFSSGSSPGMFVWLPAGGQRAATACLVTQFAEAALKEKSRQETGHFFCQQLLHTW